MNGFVQMGKGEKMPTLNIKDIPEAKIVKLVDLSEDSVNKIAEAVAQKIAVDAKPMKHGHWLFYEEPDGYYHSECSECRQWCDEDVFLKDKWHYCPNCGARMDEVEDGK